MSTLIDLLNKIKVITIRENALNKEKKKRGDSFNIFEVLKLSRNETRLHSSFIAELLNPQGSHGLKDAFLISFMEIIESNIKFDYKSVQVNAELPIGNINRDKSQGGRLDVIIKDKHNNAIVIENKIDAEDQDNQLLRYYNYCKSNLVKFDLIYLTKEGRNAPDKSTGSDGFHYINLSYRAHILKWLDNCVGIAACYPLVRETIRQYIINLKTILDIMDIENSTKLIEITTSKEYIESTLAILDASYDIQKQIRSNFICQLKEMITKYGLSCTVDDGLCSLDKDCWIVIFNDNLSLDWAIWIGAEKHNNSYGVHYGISPKESNHPEITKNKLKEFEHVYLEEEQISNFPFGWTWLRGERQDWWNWSSTDTLRDMVNGKLLRHIEDDIIRYALDNKLLQKAQLISPKK